MGQRLAWLAIAGALGTLARYGLASWVQRLAGGTFPWGTWTVNALGCLVFGFVWALAEERMSISAETRVIVLAGFMGAFTTFSAFIADGAKLAGEGNWLYFFLNFFGQNLLAFALMALGFFAVRLL
jgi:CrcB protein